MDSSLQRIFDWVTRRICGLTLLFSLCLSSGVILEETSLRRDFTFAESSHSFPASSNWTTIFALYSLFWQALTAVFYLRVCWSIVDVTNRLEQAGAVQDREDTANQRDGGDLGTELPDVVHAIVIPNYKEDIQTLRETLLVLASHPGARQSYGVYLAMEGRETDAQSKASGLIQEFSGRFLEMSFTLHPPNIPNEHPSKGSNVAWAARKLSERYPFQARHNVIVTIADSDTLFSSRYFTSLTALHRSHPKTASTCIYPAPMVFDRNADQVSGPVRLTDIFWTGIALSGYHTGSVIAPTFSAYSIPLVLIDRAGGWDVNGESMGEDIHIFIKCFFALNGNLNVRVIDSAFSSVNVVGDGTLLTDMRARYIQGLRHMWGALDCGYVIRNGVRMWLNRNHHERQYPPLHLTNQGGSPRLSKGDTSSEMTLDVLDPPNWTRLLLLWHRLLELYFMPISLCMTIANAMLLRLWQGEPPHHLRWVFTACSVLGAAGIFGLFGNIFFYSRYHELCVRRRQEEMRRVGLLEQTRFSHRGRWANCRDLCFAPVVVVVYGVAPTVQATIMQFWSLELSWVVTKKRLESKAKKVD